MVMIDKKDDEFNEFEDDVDVTISEDEFMCLNAGYVHYDDDLQSDVDWGENLEAETGLKFS